MRAARVAAMSAVAAPPAATPLDTARGTDDPAAAGPGSASSPASSSVEPDAQDAPAPEGAQPAAMPALATETPTVARSASRERHARSPHAASQPIDVAAAVLAAQARADAFLGGRAASSADSVR
jgi:hypothetical protein